MARTLDLKGSIEKKADVIVCFIGKMKANVGVVTQKFSPDMSFDQWDAYRQLVERDMKGFGIRKPARKLAYLKAVGKVPLARLLENLKPVNPEGVGRYVSLAVNDYQREIAKLNDHFERTAHPFKEIYEFNMVKQQPFERMREFVSRVMQAADRCRFMNTEERVFEQVLCGTTDGKLVNLALMKKILTVEEAIQQGTTNELLLNQGSTDDLGPWNRPRGKWHYVNRDFFKMGSLPLRGSRVERYSQQPEPEDMKD